MGVFLVKGKLMDIKAVVLLASVICPILSLCVDPPVVEHSLNNASLSGQYPVGTSVDVVCDKGYAPVGNAYFTCNGTHFVGNLTCKIRTCPRIGTPGNCRIVNEPSYEAGSVIIYDSNPGYVKVGQGTLLCRDDNRWSPEHPPVCKPKDCGHFGNIVNGQTREVIVLNGVRNAYGSVLRIDCDNGYVLNGQKSVRCQEDGSWDSRPTCEPVKCPPFPGLYSSCVYTASLFLNHYYMNCRNDVSVTKVGGGNVQCQDNGEWSSEYIGCFCDCKVETDMTNMTVSNITKGYIPHGHTLNWSCTDGYMKNISDVIKCNDGNMATPACQVPIDKPYSTEPSPVDKTNTNWLIILIPVLVALCVLCLALWFYRSKRTIPTCIQWLWKSTQTIKTEEESAPFLVERSEKSCSSQTNTTDEKNNAMLVLTNSQYEFELTSTINATSNDATTPTTMIIREKPMKTSNKDETPMRVIPGSPEETFSSPIKYGREDEESRYLTVVQLESPSLPNGEKEMTHEITGPPNETASSSMTKQSEEEETTPLEYVTPESTMCIPEEEREIKTAATVTQELTNSTPMTKRSGEGQTTNLVNIKSEEYSLALKEEGELTHLETDTTNANTSSLMNGAFVVVYNIGCTVRNVLNPKIDIETFGNERHVGTSV